MGILNLTPDSFFDGGRYNNTDASILQVEKMISEGANIIDIGAMSTRPGAEIISEEEELNRLIPILKILTKKYAEIVFSIDTFRGNVVKASADNGAGIINDISAGTLDPTLFKAVASTGLPYILMHIKGTPQTMQVNPHYDNIRLEVNDFIQQKIEEIKQFGINQIIIDPGFGFGKTISHNYALLRELPLFKSFNYPILVGISRKSMIYKLLNITPQESLCATTALNTISILNGANILRVHDIKEAMQAIQLSKAYIES